MVKAITAGIQVSVETLYQSNHSTRDKSFFAYRITIENNSDYTVQLLSRHWFIFDSDNTHRQVQGDGVVGEQPIIEPNDQYQYVSGCDFNTDIGRMYGTYTVERVLDGALLDIDIPAFEMIAPHRLN